MRKEKEGYERLKKKNSEKKGKIEQIISDKEMTIQFRLVFSDLFLITLRTNYNLPYPGHVVALHV